MKVDKRIQEVCNNIAQAAKALEVNPWEITRKDLETLGLYVHKREVLAFGGLTKLRDFYFPKDIGVEKKLDVEAVKMLSASKMLKSQKAKLTSTYGEALLSQEELTDKLSEVIKKNGIKFHPVQKKVVTKPTKKNRTIVAHLSDTHFGANIEANEVGEVNKFDWTISARRLGLFAEQIATYKTQHRTQTDLVLLINGDIIAGVIHNQEWFVDLLADQFAGTVKNLTQFISYLATHFQSVRVYCTSGNHGRAMHKGSKDRGNTHKWDSYETMIYMTVKSLIESKLKNVKVEIPKSPYAIFSAHGKSFFVTHGDTVVNLGNPGKSINIKDISNQINKLNASSLGGVNKKFDAVICGHHHTPTVQLTDSGCMLVINGCLSGADPYAQSVGYFDAIPSQQLFEVTADHAVGDMRFITLKDADSKKEYEKIIEPYVKE
jgi:predicted phosphodiesterase